MQKRLIVIHVVALVIFIAVIIFAFIEFRKVAQLNEINKGLEEEKQVLIAEREEVRTENKELKDEMQMLLEDVNKIYKSCMTENACKGKLPGIRWNCNNVGDSVENPSHICICDSFCNLNATEIKK